jgi:hypothetical protein
MADGKILKIIDDMSDYVDSHNAGPLSRDKIKISKDELFNYIDRLRQTLPNELEEASKITKAKNEILKAAMNKASQIEEDAQNQLQELIKEDEVVIAADKEAQNIVDNAEKEADDIIKEAEGMAAQIKIGALSYAEEMLATVEKMVSHNLKVTIENSNSVIDTLKNTLEIIQNNRDELNAQILEAREVNGYGPDEDESQGEKENFVEDASDGDFEEEDFADKNTGKALEEDDEFDEEDDDELFDLTEKFSFKKRNK